MLKTHRLNMCVEEKKKKSLLLNIVLLCMIMRVLIPIM